MMKSYLRYEPRKQFGVIAAPACNITYDYTGNLVFAGAVKDCVAWNLRQAVHAKSLTFDEPGYPFRTGGEVTSLMASSGNVMKTLIAVGYSTGIIRIFNYMNEGLLATLKGHNSAITALCFGCGTSVSSSSSSSSHLLVTGGADCDIVVWDLVSFSAVHRLRGHKDAITGLQWLSSGSNSSSSYVVSVSKDTLMKVWDIESQSCIQTIVGHRCEIWCLTVVTVSSSSVTAPPASLTKEASDVVVVLTGASDNCIRGYQLIESHNNEQKDSTNNRNNSNSRTSGHDNDEDVTTLLEYCGSIDRRGSLGGGTINGNNNALISDKCASLSVNAAGNILAAQSSGKSIEMFRIRDFDSIKKKQKRRVKRMQQQQPATSEESAAAAAAATAGTRIVSLTDILEALPSSTIRCAAKVRSFAFDPSSSSSSSSSRALVSLLNNSLEMYQLSSPSSAKEEMDVVSQKISVIDLHGHRSDVRGISISGDNTTLATCSAETIKLWSTRTHLCVGTCRLKSGSYCVSLRFAPGGRYLIAGTKEGTLLIFDSASGETVDEQIPTEAAFQSTGDESAKNATGDGGGGGGSIWALDVRPDGKGFMSAGADQRVTFWDFTVSPQGLKAVFSRQLQLTHDVMCCRYSPTKSQDKLLVAVGLLDSTVRVYYEDSLKFFLSLYGHKLPVMSLDISYDCSILVSGSADKTIKIWGLDFGDCHRSLIAHEDSVTCVRFQPATHYFFSSGKDGVIKYWDADRFEQILLMPGHRGSAWDLDISRDGAQLYSCGQDRSIRLWERGEDLVFIEEERERALEAQVDRSAESEMMLEQSNSNFSGEANANAAGSVDNGTAGVIVSKSIESVKGGELIMNALDLVDTELEQAVASKGGNANAPGANHSKNKKLYQNPLLLGLTPHQYMIRSLRMVKAPDMDQALLVLPFHYVTRLLHMLLEMCMRGLDVELCTKCTLHLLRCHQNQLLSSDHALSDILSMQKHMQSTLEDYRNLVGVNIAGLKAMKRQCEEDENDIGIKSQRVI